MIDMETITAAANRLAAAASSPARVILFGSYARGKATEDSDLDLMVIEKEVPDKAAEYLRLRRAIGGIGVGVDVLVYSEEEVLRRGQVPGTLPYWAQKEGRVLRDDLA
jgi:predicted nucleotidyltransferase